eukprot:1158503-Pelagomonas_calceolata.AAC.9
MAGRHFKMHYGWCRHCGRMMPECVVVGVDHMYACCSASQGPLRSEFQQILYTSLLNCAGQQDEAAKPTLQIINAYIINQLLPGPKTMMNTKVDPTKCTYHPPL